ncbi:hypothetical protein BDF14DRAFT_1753717 [Spinellus fusiger]|nr:hypothetical protein BDF14DRAFT_1753717 [Spinellus fusiger]
MTFTTHATYSPCLLSVAISTLQQSIDVLSGMENDSLTIAAESMPCGTLGKHLRHVHDHFSLLMKNMNDTPLHTWRVDYDERSRNTPMETDRQAALQCLLALQEKLQSLASYDLDTPILLAATVDPNTEAKLQFTSSLGRELWFCSLHAIHHYAVIKTICHEASIPVPKDFGTAPSTIQHQ